MRGNTDAAKRLRHHQTDAERVLWFRLRDRRLEGLKFRRQAAINRFVVDFCCAERKLVVEIDGGQHASRPNDDANRTRILEAMGYLVLRFWNHDVLRNIDGVREEILNTINRQQSSETPYPTPLPDGEREQS